MGEVVIKVCQVEETSWRGRRVFVGRWMRMFSSRSVGNNDLLLLWLTWYSYMHVIFPFIMPASKYCIYMAG